MPARYWVSLRSIDQQQDFHGVAGLRGPVHLQVLIAEHAVQFGDAIGLLRPQEQIDGAAAVAQVRARAAPVI